MQDFLLLISVVAFFIFGWFLMKGLDKFFEENEEDVAILPEPVDIPPNKEYNRKETILHGLKL